MLDWAAIERQHGPRVWSTAFRILRDYDDASDCYQDVFLEVFEKSKSETLQISTRLFQWLVVRRAIDRLRRKRRGERRLQVAGLSMTTAAVSSPDQRLETEELADVVRDALTKLPQRQAEVFWLRCIDELSYDDIGANLGISKNEVGVLLHRAKSGLRQALAKTSLRS